MIRLLSGKTYRILFLIIFVFAFIMPAAAAEAAESDYTLPYDPELVKNTLPNGLTYYIKENRKPENNIVLRLVVKAGSINEEDHQKGLAHFLEHMAFNGTKSFPGNTIVDIFETEGVRFGPDLNAYTGYDSTVYMLEIPADNEELLDTAILVLKEWAFDIENRIEEIDKERGVVIEEWRRSQGADKRISNIHTKALFEGSKYAERSPIGDIDIIKNFTREDLVSFYDDWYRPDLMAVIAAGDFDKEVIEDKIVEIFSEIPLRRLRKKRLEYPIPVKEELSFSIVSDKEASSAVFRLAVLKDTLPQGSASGYKHSIIEGLYFSMLNNRYDEIRKEKDPPFLRAGAGYGRLTDSRSAFSASVTASPDDMTEGFTVLLREIARAKEHGFTETELERAKIRYLRRMEQIYLERDSIESGSLASEYIRNFLENEPVPGIEYEYRLVEKYLPDITLEDVNSLTEQYIRENSMIVLLGAPDKESVKIPSGEELGSIIKTVLSSPVKPYEDNVNADSLIPYLPPPGEVLLREVYSSTGTEVFYLSGGAKIIVKSTDFRADEVLFTAFSRGGHSLSEDDEWASANLAPAIVSLGRLGSFTRNQLDKYLDGRIAGLSPYINELEEGFTGRSSVRDLETLFQLLHLYFAYPSEDKDSFESYMSRLKIYLSNQEAVPDFVFGQTLREILTDSHPRGRSLDSDLLDDVELEKAYSVFRERFEDPGDFTFIFTGAVPSELIVKLAEKYLDSLSMSIERPDSSHEEWIDRGIRLPDGKIEKNIYMGIEDMSQAAVIFKGNYEWSRENNLGIQALASAVEMRLRNVIREDEGGTYSISVYPSLKKDPVSEYQLIIYFGTSPERVEELKELILKEISALKESVPEDLVSRFKSASLLEYEKQLKENSFWLNAVKDSEFHDRELDSVYDYPEKVKSLNSEVITEAAAQYFDMENIIDVTLFPEALKPQP